jgi:hypothetical protein
LNVSFEICTTGDIAIYDTYAKPYPATPTVATGVPAIIISHGADADEPVQTDQQVENYGRNPQNPDTGANILTSYTATDYDDNGVPGIDVYIFADFSRDTSVDPPTQFDDIVVWISPHILMNRMIVSGRLP